MEQLKQFRRRLSSSDKGKNNYDISPSEPSFGVRYLGMSLVIEDFEPAVNGHTLASLHVQKLQQDCKAGKTLRKVNLCVSTNNERGLTVTDALTKAELSFKLHNIAYCCTNKDDPKIFSLIVEREGQLQCHGFIASKEAKARAICLALSKAFTTAYEIWSKKMKKLESKKARYGRENSRDGAVKETDEMDVRNSSNAQSAELDNNFQDDTIFYRVSTLQMEDNVFDLENNSEVLELSMGDWGAVGTEEAEKADDSGENH